MRAFLLLACLAAATLLLPVTGVAQADEPPRYTLDEARTELAHGARPGGYWRAENGYWTEGSGQPTHYGIRFELVGGGLASTGCLWGETGEDTFGPYWFFLSGWDPTEGAILVYQVNGAGGGAVGHQRPRTDGAQGHELVQDVWGPNTLPRIRHVQDRPAPDRHVDRAFDWVDGAWVPRATFTWLWTESDESPC